MTQWGGRFNEKPNKEAFDFNESFSFDKRLYKEDIEGSIAHATMLGEKKIITIKEANLIIKNLKKIQKDISTSKIKLEKYIGKYEDIHSFIEAELIKRIGDTGKKLHTARSRNDQVALDMKLFIRRKIFRTAVNLMGLIRGINYIIANNNDTYVPGFTHMQKAQPTTISAHYDTFRVMFLRDIRRLFDCKDRMNECPLGAGAFNGTGFNIDREYVSELLLFEKPTENYQDSVSDRDFVLEFLFDLTLIQLHLSRIAEEIIIWNSNDYSYIRIKDEYQTGSSMMPQKKNPDIAELIRGKSGRVFGALSSLCITMKALPFAYNKDMQEDKELTFDAIDTTNDCIRMMNKMLRTIEFNKDRMKQALLDGFVNATDLADYFVKKGVPFRKAHEIVGKIILECEKRKCTLEDFPLEEYKKYVKNVNKGLYKEIQIENCIKKRKKKNVTRTK
ncbi:MAG: argininosuccinate lyase [Eubacteriales bacterium]|nr:argininosuccinate lyase [Eubacteriales bacterium]